MCHYHSDTCKTPGKKAIERHVGQGNPAPVLFTERKREKERESGRERRGVQDPHGGVPANCIPEK